jgi:hypothetical protein
MHLLFIPLICLSFQLFLISAVLQFLFLPCPLYFKVLVFIFNFLVFFRSIFLAQKAQSDVHEMNLVQKITRIIDSERLFTLIGVK